jgi:hypothetical protein
MGSNKASKSAHQHNNQDIQTVYAVPDMPNVTLHNDSMDSLQWVDTFLRAPFPNLLAEIKSQNGDSVAEYWQITHTANVLQQMIQTLSNARDLAMRLRMSRVAGLYANKRNQVRNAYNQLVRECKDGGAHYEDLKWEACVEQMETTASAHEAAAILRELPRATYQMGKQNGFRGRRKNGPKGVKGRAKKY